MVRQAIVHAINYTDLYAKGYQENMTPYVGPEYPAWSQFYDLGKFAPYQYNLTLAKQDLAQANITNMPQFTFRTVSGCEVCASAVQDHSVGSVPDRNHSKYYRTDSGAILFWNLWALRDQCCKRPGHWSDFLREWRLRLGARDANSSRLLGNIREQRIRVGQLGRVNSNPTVQKCVNAFTATTNVSLIQDLVRLLKPRSTKMLHTLGWELSASGAWLVVPSCGKTASSRASSSTRYGLDRRIRSSSTQSPSSRNSGLVQRILSAQSLSFFYFSLHVSCKLLNIQ